MPDPAVPRTKVGVRDVAALAGVSPQTVSRVLNDHPHIRVETRRRVLDAMAALGYRVNNAARSLGTATTRTLGVIASDATLYGPAVGIAALETSARTAGRWIATAYADAADAASVAAAAEHLLAQGVDGIVVVAPHKRTLETLAELGLPVAELHGGPGADRQREGAAAAVRHLVDLGHMRIAHLAGPADWREAAARDAGVRAALAAAGVEPGPRWEGDWSAAAGAARAAEVAAAVRAPGGPTAVVVANDQMALGLIAGLAALGVDVPTDVSVTGFDDNPDAAYYRPALTTVRLDIVGEARRCIGDVLGLEAPDAPVPPTLVVRDSTAPPRS
ncbi:MULTISPECIES: LacI family DNA-binding transcriptional regulator [unclassified Microbacterium]|uniref:LacI family DNA-binding transcriptional regulator n=1 Tax=unclassified Microbacterium TaxID=2609290 RepID=UPI00214C656B|nr:MULTISPECIES: LacI family DNA-binding transcriptional regulator [unclassified Microbacterium]MCR2783619.1 LacI family transcriptional regulator [Microbacterium sp. zg.B96]WIM15523.1 LacI family DNA-binding transcriptional regulator [Microbacterium sp. zg-B96]